MLKPGKIVVGITKAVSDRFGNGGIADRMIWSNGFPFLDNKEEHVFNVPVSHAMTADPVSLPASDFPVREAEHLLNDNRFQGFPIVEDRTTKVMVGYIGRTELRYAINRVRNEGVLSPNAQCVFTKEAADAAEVRRASVSTSTSTFHGQQQLTPGATADSIQRGVGVAHVDFSRYIDHTPLTVHPRLPLETVMEIFKKMGPRAILVEHRGRLSGLVTVKDCLKYQFKVEAEENASSNAEYSMGRNNNNNNTNNANNANANANNNNNGDTFEDKVWNFMQRLRAKLPWWQQTATRAGRERDRTGASTTATARNRGRTGDGFEHQDTSRILDGTEDDGLVELEERS